MADAPQHARGVRNQTVNQTVINRRTVSRRDFLRATATSSAAAIARRSLASQPVKGRGFDVRATQETGWNIFCRKGDWTDPKDITVNYKYLDHLHQSGVNWLLVFWTNARQFDRAWAKASDYARSIGLHLGRAVYGFSGGGSETSMAEPNVPPHLLRPSACGPDTALCPHDSETCQWVAVPNNTRRPSPTRETAQGARPRFVNFFTSPLSAYSLHHTASCLKLPQALRAIEV